MKSSTKFPGHLTAVPAALPAPMVGPEVDLRSFPFMPLEVGRLRDSDMMATTSGDEFKAAMALWCTAWHQIPAGSLPDVDAVLARQTGTSLADWPSLKAGALYGFIKCSDGRLYHPVIAGKALDAWKSKLAQRDRTSAARNALSRKRQPAAGHVASDSACDSVCDMNGDNPCGSDQQRENRYREGEGDFNTDGGIGRNLVDTGGPLPSMVNGGESGTEATHDPLAAKHPTKVARGRRLPPDWPLPQSWGDWALAEFPRWTVDTVRDQADQFRDYWVSKAGRDATKLDWLGTWRNWCRRATRPKHLRPIDAANNPATDADNLEALRLIGALPRVGDAA